MNTLAKTISTLTAAGLVFGLSAQALADRGPAVRVPPPPSSTVPSSDLDVSGPEDLQVLYTRIRTAASRVCRQEHGNWWNVERTRHTRRCIETAVDNAVNAANHSRLTALHRGATQRVADL
jgi:UrcA family protein